MDKLTVIGRCDSCGSEHSIAVPDQNQVWTQENLERVVCTPCGTTLENLKLLEPVCHAGMKAAS